MVKLFQKLIERAKEGKGDEMKIAMISYNTFVDGESNGWKNNGENNVLLLQNEDGQKWGRRQVLIMDESDRAEEIWDSETRQAAYPLWHELKQALPTIDKAIIYVGERAELMINMAAEYGLAAERAIFVMCDCDMTKKKRMIHSRGFTTSKVIECECGGHNTMMRIYHKVLVKGIVPH